MINSVFPTYVVIDFSSSMRELVDGKASILVATEIIQTLLDSMRENSSVADALRVRVIGFNSKICICTPLFDYYGLKCWYEEAKGSFENQCEHMTYYGAAFEKLYECINQDIDQFKSNNEEYYRPLVYFLTDGKPVGEDSSERDNKYSKLVNNADSTRRPVIFCVGIGDADMAGLKRYGASRLGTVDGEYCTSNPNMTYQIKKGVNTAEGLKLLNSNVVATIRNSLQKRSQSDDNRVNEIDDENFTDVDVHAFLERYFNTDNLSL